MKQLFTILLLAAIVVSAQHALAQDMKTKSEAKPNSFKDRIMPTSMEYGFEMEGYWVWGMSVIKGEDGLYHGFASRWSKTVKFWPNWVSNSEVVHATSKTPEGPFEFQSVALPRRGKEFFDGMMTHNPTIHKSGDTYLLFYTGTTYEYDYPTKRINDTKYEEARYNQRVGMATSKSLWGPWERSDKPILEPRPEGHWDAGFTTNPGACVRPDGTILMVYKSTKKTRGKRGKLKTGITMAEDYTKPFKRLSDEPMFGNMDVEDPYIWWNGSSYELVMKDMTTGNGLHATSPDGVEWQVSNDKTAYTKHLLLKDGNVFEAAKLERAQVLVQNNQPTHLYFAIGISEEGRGYGSLLKTKNLCVPLKQDAPSSNDEGKEEPK